MMVSESGIAVRDDVRKVAEVGVRAILVGRHAITSEEREQK